MYTFTYQKNIASCASLLVFKIAQSLQCICKEKAFQFGNKKLVILALFVC